MLLYQSCGLEKGFLASNTLCLCFCTAYSKTIRMKATLLLFIALTPFPVCGMTHPIPVLSIKQGKVLHFGPDLCSSEVWAWKEQSALISQGLWRFLLCVFRVRSSTNFLGCTDCNFWSKFSCLKMKWKGNNLVIYDFSLENFWVCEIEMTACISEAFLFVKNSILVQHRTLQVKCAG